MNRMLSVLAALAFIMVIGCAQEEPVAQDRPAAPPPPPPPLKYQPQFGPHEAQQRYTADKPFSGNNATLPQNAPPTKTYNGTVRSVAGNSITISVSGQDMTFNCAPDLWAGDGNNPRYFQIKDWQSRVRPGTNVRLSTTNTGGGELVTYVLVTSNVDE
jgi:hypothetical protein